MLYLPDSRPAKQPGTETVYLWFEKHLNLNTISHFIALTSSQRSKRVTWDVFPTPGSRSHCGCRVTVEPLQTPDSQGTARRKIG